MAWHCRDGGAGEGADRQDGRRLAGARRPVEQQVRQLVLRDEALDCTPPHTISHWHQCDQLRRYRALGRYGQSMRFPSTRGS